MRIGQDKLIILRKIVQSCSIAAVIAIIWNTRFPLDRFVNPSFYFHIDPLVMTTTALAERVWLEGLALALALLAATAFLGRFFCAWICPLGAALDFIALLKTPFVRRRRTIEKNPSAARFTKYAVLAVIVIAAGAGRQFAWTLDPIAVFMRTFSLAVHPGVNNGLNGFFSGILMRADVPRLESVYNLLRDSFLGTDIASLSNTRGIVLLFAAIALPVILKRRLWCRYLCPLGAMLALPALLSPLRRKASCGKKCRACMHSCRMNAIYSDNSYRREECILCFDCVRDCPDDSTRFAFSPVPKRKNVRSGIDSDRPLAVSRSAFLRYSAVAALAAAVPLNAKKSLKAAVKPARAILRPPGSLGGEEFIRRCIRCGNCMKICPTGVLAPSPLKLGLDRLWAPVLDTSSSYCEYTCNLCGKVCPTGAIRSLSPAEKAGAVIGLAVIDTEVCVPYKKGIDCLVCEEHCPVPEKAIVIKMTRFKGKYVKMPVVREDLCIGCGICEVKCPTEPEKAIKIFAPKMKAALKQGKQNR